MIRYGPLVRWRDIKSVEPKIIDVFVLLDFAPMFFVSGFVENWHTDRRKIQNGTQVKKEK